MTRYNHPYTEQPKTQPIFLDERTVEHVLYPENALDYSDVCAMYLSTGGITVCTMEIGPGGMFDPPDIHPGDETYYVLKGSITLLNPAIGQCVEIHAGQAALIPRGALHSGYNFTDKPVKVLAVIAPKTHEEPPVTDVHGPKKLLRYDVAGFGPAPEYRHPHKAGRVDDIGAWPGPAKEIRESGVIVPVREEGKLLVIHGNLRPLLLKLAVSNEYAHVGEYVLPQGGPVAANAEPLCHGGEAMLYGLAGETTVFLPAANAVHRLAPGQGLYIPAGMEYRLINYGGGVAKSIFAVTGPL